MTRLIVLGLLAFLVTLAAVTGTVVLKLRSSAAEVAIFAGDSGALDPQAEFTGRKVASAEPAEAELLDGPEPVADPGESGGPDTVALAAADASIERVYLPQFVIQ